jgi:hypothetical protein
MTGAAAPAGWGHELDRGIAEAIKGPTFPVSDVIADLDADLAEMANGESDIGHGETRSTHARTNQQASGRLQNEKSSGSHSKSQKRFDPGGNGG